MTEQVTAQDVYERIRAYFSKPGARLARKDVPNPRHDLDPEFEPATILQCSYRMEDADRTVRRCAAGCLLDDEAYYELCIEDAEGEAWEMVAGAFQEALGEFTPEARHFVGDAQSTHDQRDTIDAADFVRRLDIMASGHGLEVVS